MIEHIRGVVTAIDSDGSSTFRHISDVNATAYGDQGVTQWPVWGTPSGDAVIGADRAEAVHAPPFPAVGGTRFFVVSLPPGQSGAFHTTDTIDYGVVLQGEMVLDLDDGREEILRPGACIVQRGTRHAWRNDGSEPVLAAFVVIGARRGPTPPTTMP
jgi:quercetin dioxygenase-like cupin family protein